MSFLLIFFLPPLFLTASDTSCSENFGGYPSGIRTLPVAYYIDAFGGLDSNTGTSPREAWKTLERLNLEPLIAGDTILLKSGTTFNGSLKISNVGSNGNPVFISKYGGTELPVINAEGYLAGIQISNSRNIHISGLEITSDGGVVQEAEALYKRFGIYVSADQSGEYSGFCFRDLKIHHIFATENVESDGQNQTSNMGMGININMENRDAVIKNVHIENCEISMTGHTGIKIFGSGNWPGVSYLDSVTISDNRLEKIGGPGIVPGRCRNVIVRGNEISHSGSKADPRMHNRGSGIWPWTCSDVLIENNRFMNAWGKYDSCGAHIDFNCNNVTIQYNLSYNNAGGFVEILGNNQNCIYRYNISINDGYRVKGKDGAMSDGYIFWLSNWVGINNDPVGASNCRIYNNTIYAAPHIKTGILFADGTLNNRIENNILHVEGELSYQDQGENNTFNNNLYYGNIPLLPFGNGAIFADPELKNPGDTLAESYLLNENSPAINTGQMIDNDVIFDFQGDSIAGHYPPDRGADETVFIKNMFQIESVAEEEGGRIFPAGRFAYPEDTDIPFRIIPKPGFVIDKVEVDGALVDPEPVYTFHNLNSDHTIHVDFFAPADSVTDPLNDFSLVGLYSPGMKTEDQNPGNFQGDTGRVVRTNLEPGYLEYQFKRITGFEIVFWGVNNDDAVLKVFVSGNGTDFTEINKSVVHHVNLGFRYKTVFTGTGEFPEGINFIRFEISGSDAAWKAQIGSIELSWLGEENTATGIMSLGKKSLNLYPNPAGSLIYIKGVPSGTWLKVISPTGNILLMQVVSRRLNVSGLPPGCYFIAADGFKTEAFIKK